MSPYAVALQTDVGRVRPSNEDSGLALQLQFTDHEPLLLAAVADGMGGHSHGQLASRVALRSLAAAVMQGLARVPLEGAQALADEQLVNLLQGAVQAAAQQLAEAERHGLVDMGTTLCAALLVGKRAFLANLGDSRAYLYDGNLQQLTEDHSVVQQLVNKGELTPAEAEHHPRKNEIYKLLGMGRQSQPDLFTLELEAGDRLLLCTDGLTGPVGDQELRQQLKKPLGQAVEDLIDLANRRGGDDNITALLIEVLP